MTLTRPLTSTAAPPTFADAAERHLDDVFGYLLYLTRDRPLADDLAGATFEKAFRQWSRFDSRRGSARTWLLGIARTTALDWFRAESRRHRREASRGRAGGTGGGLRRRALPWRFRWRSQPSAPASARWSHSVS